MKAWMKVQKTTEGNNTNIVTGVCDEDLLGKEIGHFKVYESFFKGELVEMDDAMNTLENATIGNIIGKHAVEAALKRGLISKEGIKEIEGIPHAQIFTVE